VFFVEHDHLVASQSSGGTVIVWDWLQQIERSRFYVPRGRVTCITQLKSERLCAVACDDGHLYWVDVSHGTVVHSVKVGKAPIRAVAFCPDRDQIAIACLDSGVTFVSARTGASQGSKLGIEGRPCSIAFDAKGTLLSWASVDGKVELWDLTGGKRLTSCDVREKVRDIQIDTSRRRAVILTESGSCYDWEWEDGKVKVSHIPQHSGITCITSSADCQWKAVGGSDGTITLHPESKRKTPLVLDISPATARAVSFSSDSRLLVVGDTFGTVRVFSLFANRWLTRRDGPCGRVSSLAITDDGSVVASSGVDRIVRIWSTFSRREVGQLKGHTDEVTSLRFGDRDQILFSGARLRDADILAWDVASMSKRSVFRSTGAGKGVAMSPDGKHLNRTTRERQ
jgi:WD40 repeat protein